MGPRIGAEAESAGSPDSQAARANPSRKKQCGYAKAAKKNGKTEDKDECAMTTLTSKHAR